jgi:hypothetical protein
LGKQLLALAGYLGGFQGSNLTLLFSLDLFWSEILIKARGRLNNWPVLFIIFD